MGSSRSGVENFVYIITDPWSLRNSHNQSSMIERHVVIQVSALEKKTVTNINYFQNMVIYTEKLVKIDCYDVVLKMSLIFTA